MLVATCLQDLFFYLNLLAMKGAPLWRGLWIAVAIALVGGLLQVGQGARREKFESTATKGSGESMPEPAAHFVVQPSPGVARVRLYDAAAAQPTWELKWEAAHEWRGHWERLPSVIGVQVEVEPAARSQRVFVKIAIEPDGSDSITRVFDGIGDVDERWELP